MNYKRLLRVAQALRESDYPSMFTMVRYVHDCGTPACALGHYAEREDLQSAFCIDNNRLKTRDSEGFWFVPDPADMEVCEHFDITPVQAEELFEADGCGGAVTAKAAADYIEAFVARAGKREADGEEP